MVRVEVNSLDYLKPVVMDSSPDWLYKRSEKMLLVKSLMAFRCDTHKEEK